MNVSYHDINLLVFVQIVIILLSCKVLTYLGNKFLNQTSVTCEMLAGIFLGPSVLGYFFPELFELLFPPTNSNSDFKFSKLVLFTLSQIGLMFYMFSVGYEFSSDGKLKDKAKIYTIAIIGILSPMLFGVLMHIFWPSMTNRLVLSDNEDYKNIIVPVVFALSFSVTALPMLARILDEYKLLSSRVGKFAMSCASIDDVFTWLILAIILCLNNGNINFLLKFFLGIVFLFVMTKILAVIMKKYELYLNESYFQLFLVSVFFIAVITEFSGVYAVFSSFMLGIFLPKIGFLEKISVQLRFISKNLFIPVFFIYSGLNINLIKIFSGDMIIPTILCVLISLICKGVVCTISLYFIEKDIHKSLIFGSLLNARGLMELIFLNILLEEKMITTEFYSIMALMAFVTTFIASPIFKISFYKLKSSLIRG